MSNMECMTSWRWIQQGAEETERLIIYKEYNLVMVRTRQVLEYMVRCMVERAYVMGGDLPDTIDQLYEDQRISKATKGNYHTIRVLGDRAVYGGDNMAYGASQASQLLTQEAYVLANEFAGNVGGRAARPSPATRNTSDRPAPRQGSGGGKSAPDRNGQRVPARNTRSDPSRQDGPRKRRRRVSPAAYIPRLLIPVLLVILLTVVTHASMPGEDREADKTTTVLAVATVPVETIPTLSPEPETEPEAGPPTETYRIKGNSVNIRSKPFTSDRILVQLSSNIEMVYVRRYDNDWAVINYDGQEAYVSSKFIEEVEPVASTGRETGSSEAQTDSQADVFAKIIWKKLMVLDAERGRIQKVLPLFGVLL